MPKRKRKTESCGPKKKQNRASSGLNAHKKRTDPFTLLPWDCASIVLQYLDIRDLACCEQLSKGWRSFVQHWLVVAGHQYCLPDGWRPDIPNPVSYEDALAAVKKSGTSTSTIKPYPQLAPTHRVQLSSTPRLGNSRLEAHLAAVGTRPATQGSSIRVATSQSGIRAMPSSTRNWGSGKTDLCIQSKGCR